MTVRSEVELSCDGAGGPFDCDTRPVFAKTGGAAQIREREIPVRNPLTDKIAQAIGDPGSIVGPCGKGEISARWSARAVESVLGYVTPPEGLDARYVAMALTIHCSNCGDPYEGEFGSMRFTPDDLHKISEYGLDDNGWVVNIDGLHDDDVDGRKLVCPNCLEAGWCEVCDEQIRAWQHVVHAADIGVIHEACAEQPSTTTRPYLSGGES